MKRASVQFDSGISPVIGVVNLSTADMGLFPSMVGALQAYVDQFFGPAWGVGCTLKRAAKPVTKAWNLLFLDDADAADALGYHDITKDGFPVLKIFVRTTIAAGEVVSVTASHELAEALIDPGCQLWAQNGSKELWAYETADAVEESTFKVNGYEMSNFVLPAFFEAFNKRGPFDHLGLLKKPFSLLKGGYTIVQAAGKVGQKFGSVAKQRRFENEDRRQHRSESRR